MFTRSGDIGAQCTERREERNGSREKRETAKRAFLPAHYWPSGSLMLRDARRSLTTAPLPLQGLADSFAHPSISSLSQPNGESHGSGSSFGGAMVGVGSSFGGAMVGVGCFTGGLEVGVGFSFGGSSVGRGVAVGGLLRRCSWLRCRSRWLLRCCCWLWRRRRWLLRCCCWLWRRRRWLLRCCCWSWCCRRWI